tara:strand:- start:386 stop:904 length:519 start_codon:yes stop_codon:yes gene_type:complete
MKENKITQNFLQTAHEVLSGKTDVVSSFQEQLDDEISTMLENVYETLTLDEQDEFEALLDLHEEGEISDEELVEGLLDYATSAGRAKKKLERSKKKTAKMQGKRDAKASKIKAKRKVKSDLGAEKKKQAAIKAKNRANSKVRKTVKKVGSAAKKGLSKVGSGLKKVFGKSKD